MPRALKVCSASGCPELVPAGRCESHQRQADQRRGTAAQRGYDTAHVKRFRRAVLLRDPLCVCTATAHGHGPECLAPSTDADHHPRDRRELTRLGLDPNDPQYGRGLCGPCHRKETAATSPGGWHR